MDRYLIETPYDAENCHKLVDQISAMGYLHHFEWGCADGVHCGWAIIETDSSAHARQMVPWSVRGKARIIKLTKFEKVDSLHTK
jgi:hypothetical protein